MKKKNLVIIHTDQQRFDSLACNGNEHAVTPNIDKLALEGSRFTRHITAAPTCMPSRASLLTGLYVPGHGVSSNGIPLWRKERGLAAPIPDKDKIPPMMGIELPDKVPTLADMLSEEGYQTALFGKLHLEPTLSEEAYGFHESKEMWGNENFDGGIEGSVFGFKYSKMVLGHGEQPCRFNGGHYGRWLHQKHPSWAKVINKAKSQSDYQSQTRQDIFLSKLPSKYHNSMWIAKEVCDYLEVASKDRAPMFMFIGIPDPHRAYSAPEDVMDDFNELPLPEFSALEDLRGEKPKACLRMMKKNHTSDEDCARAYRNTMGSIYLLDQAVGQIVDQLKALNIYEDTTIVFTSDHGDFLGDLNMLAKADLPFKNLVNVPFIIKGPKGLELPDVVDQAMSNVDVIPTVMNLIGVEARDHLQGVDIYSEGAKGNTPMVTCYGVAGDERNLTIYDDTYRYTYYLDSKEEELYNHKLDPRELNNLAMNLDVDVKDLCREYKIRLMEKHIECESGVYNHFGLW